MRRVLLISPHFPPDSSAAAHRMRLLAPHLPGFGWEPTVLAVDPAGYEGRLDPDLERAVPATLRVVRSRAWSPRWTRRIGFGDLGLRAWVGLRRTCARLLTWERFDALLITIYPVYPATLGPIIKRRFGIPFVLDYQDPWVGAWGATVGGGAGGRPDLRSRLSRSVGLWLEPPVVSAADAITTVSDEIYEQIARRVPRARSLPHATLPLGGEPRDFDGLVRRASYFDAADGQTHLCYVGTLLPEGRLPLRALFSAARMLRQLDADAYQRLRFWFIGTSNQSTADGPAAATEIAREEGVADRVGELPGRIPYFDALGVLASATGILLLGSTESHYTASKLYPALLARRPLLALFHESSSVSEILGSLRQSPAIHLVTWGEGRPLAEQIPKICEVLQSLDRAKGVRLPAPDLDRIGNLSARALSGRLASILDAAVDYRGSAALGPS